MLRSTASRTLLKSITKVPASRSSFTSASALQQTLKSNSLRELNNARPKAPLSFPRPAIITSLPYATKSDPPNDVKTGVEVHPELVTGESSVRQVFEHSQAPKEDVNEMTAGIKADLKTIKETFELNEVPRETLYLGLAGVLPYAATCLSTIYLSRNINHAGDSPFYIFTAEEAQQYLELVTPIQIGYGAVIISFLGAIHWGLEYAGYGGHHGYRRYMIGVAAPAIAWPTTFMTVEYALITQFGAYVFFYFADARATVRGWCPPWYATYRFVLTAIAGAAIVFSLIGHGQIIKHEGHLKSPVNYAKPDKDAQWEALEREEMGRQKKLAAEDEEGGDDEEKSKEADDESEDTKSKGKKKSKADDKKGDEKKDAKKDEGKDEKKGDKK